MSHENNFSKSVSGLQLLILTCKLLALQNSFTYFAMYYAPLVRENNNNFFLINKNSVLNILWFLALTEKRQEEGILFL